MDKIIRSRSNKNIGDTIEENWEITGKKVIADPHPGDRARGIQPRLGIYDYEVKAINQLEPVKLKPAKAKTAAPNVGGTRREASSVPMTVRRTS